MRAQTVIFFAFKEFDNLGVGYLASVLSEGGYKPLIIDLRTSRAEILKLIKKLNPLILGFSVIFQYHIYEFKKLITFLRKSGITAHFSAGGQYASLRHEDLFKLIPSLDSIVRFEGEYTFLELVKCVYSKTDWRKIQGLAYFESGKTKVNPLRPSETDLDKFPFPMRSPIEDYALDKKFATILASRGCVNNCSFCSNTEYIRQSLLPVRRIRKPEKVVEEMNFLHKRKDCSVFLFEDDDFPVNTKNGSDWIEKFCKELKRKKLVDKIIWKINCRPDEVEFNRFSLMKGHGLYLVFLGIDDGTDSGLARLNKRMTIAKSVNGINNLKRLGIGFDYGFMLFQPTSTFTTVNNSIDFLRQFTLDGSTPVTFLKLMPYFETRVERDLRKDGRLKGRPGFWDYDFIDISLNEYYDFIKDSFMEWVTDSKGLANTAKWARNYFSVFSHFYNMTPDVLALSAEVKQSVARSNTFILDTMMELSRIFETGKYDNQKLSDLTGYKDNIKEKHDHFKKQIVTRIKEVGRYAEYQTILQLVKQ